MGPKFLSSAIPVSFGFLVAIMANIPIPLLGDWMSPPLLVLMPIYFWCLVRPDLMSPAWAFVLGVVQDLMSGGYGIWTVSIVAMYILIDRQRDTFAGLSGWGAILGFATAALAVCFSAYTILAVYDWTLRPLAPLAIQFALTVLFYVPGVFLLGLVHRRFVGPLRSDF